MKKKASSVIFGICVVLTAIICLMGIRARLTGEPITIAGYGFTKVVSASMEPTMMTNGYAIFKTVDSVDDVQKGDIIVFKNPNFGYGKNALFCHRAVAINDDGITTWGDNNEHPDPFTTPAEDVVGEVVLICNGIGPVRPGAIMLGFIAVFIVATTVMDLSKKRKSVEPQEKMTH